MVLNEVSNAWLKLPPAIRSRIYLARLPMEDPDENAAIVNAIQREAAVVVQKSLAEGFGLTVAEAMWKGRPMVASRVGGIQDQIEDGRSGILVDPTDLQAYGSAITQLLSDPDRASQIGAAAKARVRNNFLAPRLLMQQARLITHILEPPD